MVLVRIEEGQGNAIGMLDSGAILMQSSVHCSFPACGTVSPNRDFVKVVQCAVTSFRLYTLSCRDPGSGLFSFLEQRGHERASTAVERIYVEFLSASCLAECSTHDSYD
jgi:hypothetical protein